MTTLLGLSVILPVLNERDNLAELIPEIIDHLEPVVQEFEIIVVNDSSTDGTDDLMSEFCAKDLRVRHLRRTGLPASLPDSLADGVGAAAFDHIAWLDADGSMPPQVLVELVSSYRSSLATDPVVVGSRFISGGGFKGIETVGETRWWQVLSNLRESNDSVSAVVLSRVLNRYLWLLLGRCCRDLASGFVVVSRESATRLGFRGYYGDYCVRFLYLAHRRHHEIIEVPYVCQVRRHGYSKTGSTLASLVKRGLPYVVLPLKLRRSVSS